MATSTLLDLELYDEALAARLLRVPQSTLHWWLEGADRGEKHYEPVLRVSAAGSKYVTWGEFVEATYLREYRRRFNVPLPELRSFIAALRDKLGVAYPLAAARPWVGPGRRLLLEAEREAGLDPDLWPCVEPATGAVPLLLPGAQSFYERVEFSNLEPDGVVIRVWPLGSKGDGPAIDPQVRFGQPAIKGIPTEAIVGQVRGGDLIEAVAEDFNLTLGDVVSALGYEGIAA